MKKVMMRERKEWIFTTTHHFPGNRVPEKYEFDFFGTENEAREKLKKMIDNNNSAFTVFTFRRREQEM